MASRAGCRIAATESRYTGGSSAMQPFDDMNSHLDSDRKSSLDALAKSNLPVLGGCLLKIHPWWGWPISE